MTTKVLLAFALLVVCDAQCFQTRKDEAICVNFTTQTLSAHYLEPNSTDSGSDSMDQAIAQIYADMDTVWVLFAGILVFFMQAGFSMLEAGSVASKNVQNILYKNLMDACIGAMCFWILGYGLAYGDADDGSFIGSANFALSAESNEGATYHSFFFQWAFAATAATIVSGSVAERCKLSAYFIYSIVLTTFIYPVVVHWIWDTEGWLCAWGETKFMDSHGFVDFAGSGVVHMVGGFSGLMGAIMCGPRDGRFQEGGADKYKPHNVLVGALGVTILWFGWYGFNAGSTLLVSGGVSAIASKVCVTTTLAAAAGAITCTVYSHFALKTFDLMLSLNGVLAGLVSITAGCSVVDPWQAAVIAVIGAFLFILSSAGLKKAQIDDPLDAFPIHGICGFWGVLAVGIFASDANLLWAYGSDAGALSTGKQFLVQLIGGLCIMAWTTVTAGLLFFLIKITNGLRVDASTEEAGLDASEHGGRAYNEGTAMLGGAKGAKDADSKHIDVEMQKTDE
jgi:Amt family ammonium transporter